MSLKKAAITGVHGYVPDYIMTNQELETLVETSDEWIRTRTGIHERRVLKKEGWAASDMCVEAIKPLLEKTGTDPKEIDLIICGTITGDRVFPDTATTIADKIGATNAWGFDLNAACSGFLYALTTGSKFIEAGTYKKVIVIGVDVMSSILDYTDRSTCIIFGDGAGAVLLEPDDEYGIQDSVLYGDGSGRQFLNMKAGGSLYPTTAETVANREHFIFQDGRPVFRFAVRGMSEAVKEILSRNELPAEEVNWLVPHQANIRIIQTVASQLDFPMERVMVNIHKFGNTTAGTLPLCLWDYESKLKKGDNVILTAFGGGFTWGATLVKWGY